MGATVEITFQGIDVEEKIECNYAKVKDGCVMIAHHAEKDSKTYVSEYIPLAELIRIKITTDKKTEE